ncbi:PAS domain-containing sensor histidine kinase [Granulicella sp. L46]|uniref:PAS domain-containing sensor histidine kinase n=1 Tax=Granulicella sp. L46 TaxID=1641865 RepID=UPI0020B153C6|nr:PAS domain-containing sensor histidine kinase [Granulicella sp. L46]
MRAVLGCLTACIAVGITHTVTPLRAFSLLLAFPTVILTAWFFGMWGGAFCAITETVLVNYFLTKSQLRFSLGNAPQAVRLGVFLLLSIMLCWIIRQSAQKRANQYIETSQRRLIIAKAERELAEARAAISEALRNNAKHLGELAAIVDSSDDVILSKDLNGTITSWNAAATRVFGYSAEEMVGTSILRIIPEHLHSDEQAIIENIRNGRRMDHFETMRLTKDGTILDVSLTISPIRDDQGKIIGASKILRDISNRKRMEQSLLQAEKIAATGRMAATIAHEINNPLEAVINLLYLLRPMITDPDGINYLSSAENELGRVSHIAKQTLGYYREHAAAVSASLAEIVSQAVTIYEPRCRAVGVEIKMSLNSTQKVVMRRGEMMQVISNLITNSIYAMPVGGVLSISVDPETSPANGVVFTIRDTGVGIGADDLPKVFDAFFTTRRSVGTGIGLYIAKQFIEGHGGQIELESNDAVDNHGTTVRVFLPITTGHQDSTTATRLF